MPWYILFELRFNVLCLLGIPQTLDFYEKSLNFLSENFKMVKSYCFSKENGTISK